MQKLLQDVFREAIDKTKQIGMWEKLTIEQKEALVSRYLQEYHNKKRNHLKAAVSARY
jgi:hypothetical protein